MDIQVAQQGDYKILRLSGDIDYFNITLLKTAIFQLINDKIPKLVLDLKDVKYMDSSGIGLIVTAYKVMDRYGGTISLMHVIDEIQVLLKLATVDTFLNIYSSEDELK